MVNSSLAIFDSNKMTLNDRTIQYTTFTKQLGKSYSQAKGKT